MDHTRNYKERHTRRPLPEALTGQLKATTLASPHVATFASPNHPKNWEPNGGSKMLAECLKIESVNMTWKLTIAPRKSENSPHWIPKVPCRCPKASLNSESTHARHFASWRRPQPERGVPKTNIRPTQTASAKNSTPQQTTWRCSSGQGRCQQAAPRRWWIHMHDTINESGNCKRHLLRQVVDRNLKNNGKVNAIQQDEFKSTDKQEHWIHATMTKMVFPKRASILTKSVIIK